MTEPAQTHNALAPVLQWGFRLALALLLTGVAIAAVRGDGLTRHVEPIRSLPAGIRHGRSAAFVDAGFVVLLVTPSVCVASLFIGYVRRRNWPLTAATAIVLATLGVGLVLAFR